MSSDTDNGSLYGGFIDLALGSDLDGLTDRELNDELELISDEEDRKNITVKDMKAPTKIESKPRKLSSAVVIPEAASRTIDERNPRDQVKNSPYPKPKMNNGKKNMQVNSNGAIKRTYKKSTRNTEQKGSLVKLLSRAENVKKETHKGNTSTPKRARSPDEKPLNMQQTKRRNCTQVMPPSGESKAMNEKPNEMFNYLETKMTC